MDDREIRQKRAEIIERINKLSQEANELKMELDKLGVVSNPKIMVNLLEMTEGKLYLRQDSNDLWRIKDGTFMVFRYGAWSHVINCNPNARIYHLHEFKEA